MKKLIAIAVFLFSSMAFAMGENDLFITENQSGGEIILFPENCPVDGSEGARVALTTMKDGYVLGCWFLYENVINVFWFPSDGTPVHSIYDPEIFNLEKTI